MHNFKPSDLFDHLAKNTPKILVIQSIFILIIVFIYNLLSFNENHLKQKEINYQIMVNLKFFEKNPASVKDLYSELIFNSAVSELDLENLTYSDFYKNLIVSNARDDVLSLDNRRNIEEIYLSFFAEGQTQNKSTFIDELIKQITKIKPKIYKISYNLDKNNNLSINQLISLLELMNEKINKRSQLLFKNFENKKTKDLQIDVITIKSKIFHLKNLLSTYSNKSFLYKYFDDNLSLIETRFVKLIQTDLEQKIYIPYKVKSATSPNNDNLNLIHKDLITLDKQVKELIGHYDIKLDNELIINILSPIEYKDSDSIIKYKKIRDTIILSFNFLLLVVMYFIFTFFRKKRS